MEEELKKALMEAARWETQLTPKEKSKITFGEARQLVVNRIFKKYKDKILKVNRMEIFIGQKAKHKDLYNAKEIFEVVGIKENEVLLKGDFSGGTHAVEQESWLPKKGLILRNMWGAWIDKENEIDFTKNAGQRD